MSFGGIVIEGWCELLQKVLFVFFCYVVCCVCLQSYLLLEQLLQYKSGEEHDEFSLWYAEVEQSVQ